MGLKGKGTNDRVSSTKYTNLIFLSISLCIASMVLNVSYAASFTASNNLFTLTNTTIDVGQVSIANTAVSGGSYGPYTGQWSWFDANLTNNLITDTINVGNNPQYVAFGPSGTIAYAANYDSNTISVINTATNTVINTITVGINPVSATFNPSGTLVYVTNSGSSSVNVINVASNTVVNTIIVGAGPVIATVNPSGTLVYVANYASNTIDIINAATNAVINTIKVGVEPQSIAFNPSGTLAYIVNFGSNTVNVINVASNTVVNTINVGSHPYAVAVNPSGTLAYITNSYSSTSSSNSTISVVNTITNTIVNSITVQAGPVDVSFNPSGTIAYVANWVSNTVSVINTATNTVVNTINVGSNPITVAFSPFSAFAYVANSGSASINVIGDLQETGLQNLPTVQTSNGLLQLTVNVVSGNQIIFTLNGISYTQTVATGTLYGTLSLYSFAQDSASAYYYGSNTLLLSNTIKINPDPDPTVPVPSNVAFDLGQYVTYNAMLTGGTAPFTVNLVSSNGMVVNTLILAAAIPSAFPSKIVDYIPITISNQQSSALSSNAQIQISFNALQYQNYETNSLNNTEFFYANGTVIPSWLEGNSFNAGQSANTLYTSANVIFWVRLASSATLLPASSKYSIYMGFAGKIPSTANTLINGVTAGESPLLSSTYGQYDNGANVFTFYDNFAGSSLNSNLWSNSGSNVNVMVNNGLKLKLGSSGSYGYIDSDLVFNPQTTTLDAYAYFNALAPFPPGSQQFLGFTDNNGNQYLVTDGWSTTDYQLFVNNYDTNVNGGADLGVGSTVKGQMFTLFGNPTNFYGQVNYGALVTNAVGYNAIIGSGTSVFIQSNTQANTINVQYIRLRATPPNGVAPSISFGAIAPAAAAISFKTLLPQLGSSSYYVSVTDSASTPFTANSITNTITVNPVPSAPTISPSSAQASTTGQTFTFAAYESSGTPPYTYNFLVYNSTTNILVANMLTTSNTFAWQIPAADAYNAVYANVIVTDSAPISLSANSILSGTITITPPLVTTTVPSGGGIGGSGGSGVSTTIGITSSATTTLGTTTIVPTTTVLVQVKNTTVTYNLTGGVPQSSVVNGFSVLLYTNTSGESVTITISNLTGDHPSSPENLSAYSVLNISIDSPHKTTVNLTISYPCSLDSANIKVLQYLNGTWIPFTDYTLNPASCQITYHLHSDPIIGIFSVVQPNTTSVVTTAQSTTTIPQTTSSNSSYLPEWVAAVVVVLVVLWYFVFVRRNK